MPRSDVEIDTRVLNRILRNLDGNVDEAVLAVAFDVEGKAKVLAQQRRAIDTGAYVNSIYTRAYNGTHQDGQASVWGQIDSKVQQRRPEAQTKELPQPGKSTAHVGPSVEYAPAIEYGTTRMTGRPNLTDAVRQAERQLAARFGNVCTDGAR